MPNYLSHAVDIHSDGNSIGSGFLVKQDSSIYLVTAAHVLFQVNDAGVILDSIKVTQIKMRVYSPKKEKDRGVLLSIDYNGLKMLKKHSEKDICIIKIANIGSTDPYLVGLSKDIIAEKNDGDIRAFSSYDILGLNELSIGEEIRIIGYPSYLDTKHINGVITYDYNYPLVQEGIVSGVSDNLSNIIISGATYYGNSGGAVLSWEKKLFTSDGEVGLKTDISLIGIVSSFIPFTFPKSNPLQTKYDVDVSNSGYTVVVPIKYAMELMK